MGVTSDMQLCVLFDKQFLFGGDYISPGTFTQRGDNL